MNTLIEPGGVQGGAGRGDKETNSPRDEALLITRQRPKGLKVVSYPKCPIDSVNPFLGGQSLRVLGEKCCFPLKK